MHHINPKDPFFTPEVVEYMRQKNLENISYEENVEVLQAVIDVYSLNPEIRYDWTGNDVAHEAEAVYFSRKVLKAKRLEAAKLVEVDGNVVTLDKVFAILSYRDKGFKEEYLELVASRNGEDYYLKMMVAWYFATALAKRYDETVRYFENRKLDEWVHRKAIQKAVESYRISDEHKEYLKSLR